MCGGLPLSLSLSLSLPLFARFCVKWCLSFECPCFHQNVVAPLLISVCLSVRSVCSINKKNAPSKAIRKLRAPTLLMLTRFLDAMHFECFYPAPNHLLPISGVWWDDAYERCAVANAPPLPGICWYDVVCLPRHSARSQRIVEQRLLPPPPLDASP
jgi:hypothetical protein